MMYGYTMWKLQLDYVYFIFIGYALEEGYKDALNLNHIKDPFKNLLRISTWIQLTTKAIKTCWSRSHFVKLFMLRTVITSIVHSL